ncbi:MAG TPA: ribose 5-phosphate isomerase B [Bacteroidota bacterium]|nr:ribose 5-phosphate isomerase B [Bacteroidota bacterium]
MSSTKRTLITEADVLAAVKRGEQSIAADDRAIVTPAAREIAARYGLEFTTRLESPAPQYPEGPDPKLYQPENTRGPNASTTIVLGADHGGFQLKETLRTHLLKLGYMVADVGTHSEATCDYPEIAYAVATFVASGRAAKGIMVDGVGAASAIVANKVPGVRAVAAYTEFIARSSREHNDANVLTLGGRVTGSEAAKSIVDVWLSTWFGGGRHQGRLNKIVEIEKRWSK